MRHTYFSFPIALLAASLPFAACKSETTCEDVGGDPDKTYPDCGPTTGGSAGAGGSSGKGGNAGRGGTSGTGGNTGQAGSSGDGAGGTGGSSVGGAAGEGGSAMGGTVGEGGSSGSTGSGGDGGSAGEAGAAGAAGGGETCDDSLSPTDEPCLLSPDYAVFVSPEGDDSAAGTKSAPFKTLDHALTEAHEQQKIVVACSTRGAFEQAVTIDADLDGSRLYGGFDCASWEYSTDSATAVVSPDPVALRVDQLSDGLTIEGFSFTAANATALGGSSIGAFVTDSQNVTLRRVAITAGSGAPGEDGTGIDTPAESGAPGNNGVAACMADAEPNGGGSAAQTMCNGVPSDSIGGKGGDGGTGTGKGGDGQAGVPLLGAGAAGRGEDTASCARGGDGNAGLSGASGKGGAGRGDLTAEGYVGAAGKGGGSGEPGQGGGGGGGSKAPVTCALKPVVTGASGGSGGGGGCGGKGGTGGGGGGASIAIASVDSTIMLENVQLTALDGGGGGDGGVAQLGGDGGNAGDEADGGTARDSCLGGAGGDGGNGGYGAGGAGGPSIGIAYVGTLPLQTSVNIAIADVAAPGGADGAQMTTGDGAGEAGVTEQVVEF